MKKNNKGFTLAEMLIVVAIIGILIAVLVPTFSAQKSKAEAAKDQANVRSVVAEVTANGLSGAGDTTKSVTVTSSSNLINQNIGGASITCGGGKTSVTVTYSDGVVTVSD